MATERDIQRLNYIRDSIERVETYTRNDRGRLLHDDLVQDAVLRRLETLADATSKLPGEMRERHPEVDWYKVRGFRNVAAHMYENIDMLRIWDIVENYLPALKVAIEAELHNAGDAGNTPP